MPLLVVLVLLEVLLLLLVIMVVVVLLLLLLLLVIVVLLLVLLVVGLVCLKRHCSSVNRSAVSTTQSMTAEMRHHPSQTKHGWTCCDTG